MSLGDRTIIRVQNHRDSDPNKFESIRLHEKDRGNNLFEMQKMNHQAHYDMTF